MAGGADIPARYTCRMNPHSPGPRRAAAFLVPMMLAAFGLGGCKGGDPAGGKAGGGKGANGPVPVVMATVRMQPWQDTLRALGTVKGRESVTVTAKVSETVQQVHFDSGDAVARGAPLVTLSGQQQVASLAAAEASAKEADALYKRQAGLAAQQLIARASLDAQRATRDAAFAQVAQIRANLSDRVIRAPFAGVLGIRQVSPGALVTPGTVIATLDDIASVYIDFPVPETQLAGIGSGQAITATGSAWPGQTFDGTVQVVSPRLDAGSRAATVRGAFPNPRGLLKPGMLLDVAVVRGEREAVVVPEIAVVQVGSETYAWRVRPDGTVEKAPIEVGGRVPGQVMVANGLKAGDRIVTDGVNKLKPGAKVKAVAAAAG